MTRSDEDTADAGFSTIADLLRDARMTFNEVGERHRWSRIAGSQAAVDEDALWGVDPNVSQRDQLAGFDLIVEVAVTEMEIASLHLEGLAALFDRPWSFLTTDIVSRSTIEALGYALWMLAPTDLGKVQLRGSTGAAMRPAEAARIRLARAYLLHVASGVRDKEFDAVRAGDDKLGAARLVEAKRRCRAAFPASTTRKLEGSPTRAPQLEGEQLPGLAAMVKLFFDTALKHDALVATAKQTNAVYGFLSTAAHPTLFRVRELRRASADPDRAALELELPSEVPTALAAMTIGLFYLVLRAFVNYFGYPTDLTDELADRINAVLPGTIV